MTNPIRQAKEEIGGLIRAAFVRAAQKGLLPSDISNFDFIVEIPKEKGHGDFAANAAMQGARLLKMPPRAIAEILLGELCLNGTGMERAEVAGPGFLNFYVRQDWLSDTLSAIAREGKDYGRTDINRGSRIMVEFVSANPTGPMHMGNARGGAIGDCLAEVLSRTGAEVTREFYINDAGNQMDKFELSLEARYLQIIHGEDAVPFPEDGYQGDDIRERAQEFYSLYGERYKDASPDMRRQALRDYGLEENLKRIKEDLTHYRIYYDVWFSESSLYESKDVERMLELLREGGFTYKKDGALWYAASRLGSDKDEVLVRANGTPTYLAADIAYHYNKFAVRGFDRVINIWGADHHGHVARLKNALDAVGLDKNRLDVVLIQLVRLLSEGKPVKMSKRTGKSITLRDLLEETSVDAARFYFNLRQADSHFDFDLDLAVSQSAQNPVYYVQYAHARIQSILRLLVSEGGDAAYAKSAAELSLLTEPEETDLIKILAALPEEIAAAAEEYDPSRLTKYAVEAATLFHKFYNAHRVKCDDPALMRARTALIHCVRTVLANVLDILKVDAPERM